MRFEYQEREIKNNYYSKGRKVIEINFEDWQFNIDFIEEYLSIGKEEWRVVRCPFLFNFTLNPKIWKLGFTYFWYDGPHNMLDIGPLGFYTDACILPYKKYTE